MYIRLDEHDCLEFETEEGRFVFFLDKEDLLNLKQQIEDREDTKK